MLFAFSAALGAVPADRVDSLPGFGVPPTAHYSGYIPVGNLSQSPGLLHYWLQMSENDPAHDPTVLWLNGGPGASGIIGMLTELGQLQTIPSPGDSATRPAAGAAPSLYHSLYGWTKVANLLTIEQPKGVGFSYCTGSGSCANDDLSTAQDTYEALLGFFERYPELKANPFYITGESYAGVYIPMIMDQIDNHGGIPQLVGAAIGNGCWGSQCFYGVHEAQIDYHTFEGQDFISPATAEQIAAECGKDWLGATATEGTCAGKLSNPKCFSLLKTMCAEVGNGAFNVYNMYDTCYPSHGLSLQGVRQVLAESRRSGLVVDDWRQTLHTHPALHVGSAERQAAQGEGQEGSEGREELGQLNDYACGAEGGMSKWLDDEEVQEALHVQKGGRMRYDSNVGDLRELYKKLIAKYKITIYSGNVDACVPTWGSEFWTRELGEPHGVVKPWHPWYSASSDPGSSSHVIAGYAITYGLNNFTFVTIKGAGHEVPRYKPRFALSFLTKFLSGDGAAAF